MSDKTQARIAKRNAKLFKASHRSAQVYWFVRSKVDGLRKIHTELKQGQVSPAALLWLAATYPLQVQWHICRSGLSMLGDTCKDLGLLKR